MVIPATILVYFILGLVFETVICLGTSSPFQNLAQCLTSSESLSVLFIWPIVAIGSIMHQPIAFVVFVIVLVLAAWFLLRFHQRLSQSKLRK